VAGQEVKRWLLGEWIDLGGLVVDLDPGYYETGEVTWERERYEAGVIVRAWWTPK
jgi:hypothetical protein